jgi:hypothetical protein
VPTNEVGVSEEERESAGRAGGGVLGCAREEEVG